MKNNIDWGKIKDGFRGFEKLACDYVQQMFPTGSWEKTKETGDGNKDAYSIILGFRPNAMACEEWWMEAKYSQQKQVLPRYRLDATIVSAAIHGHVSKIIFVTNVMISAKSMIDLRLALKQTLNCGEVHFCTKTMLEYWLVCNDKYFEKYFCDQDRINIQLTPLFLTEEAEVYSSIKHNQAFTEPLKVLQKGNQYYLYFSVFSTEETELPLSIADTLGGILLISSGIMKLQEGENNCCIQIEIGLEYKMQHRTPDNKPQMKTDYLDGAVLCLGSLDILCKQSLTLTDPTEIHLEIASQKLLLNRVKTQFQDFIRYKRPAYFSIEGDSGIGKSFLLDQFTKDNIQPGDNFFSITFTDNIMENQKLVCDIFAFIFFPYLPSNSIDEKYLEAFGLQYSFSDYTKALLLGGDSDLINHLFDQASWNTNLFPAQLQLNKRIILLDDIHKLDIRTCIFLYIIFAELSRKAQPVFVIFSGWPGFQSTKHYNIFKQNVQIIDSSLILTPEDLVDSLRSAKLLSFDLNPHLCKIVFPSIIDLLQFFRFYRAGDIQDVNSFLLAANLFLNTDMAAGYILNLFQNLFRTNPECKKLCDLIYWSVNGVKVNGTSLLQEQEQLLKLSLIKFTENGDALIPYHDRYQQVYRKYMPRPENTTLKYTGDTAEDTQNILLYSLDRRELERSIELLNLWKREGKFFSLLYVLEAIFDIRDKNLLRNKLGDYNFFRLYLFYGFAVANQSRTRSGKKIFEEIHIEAKLSIDPKVKRIRAEATFELINSSYEWLEYDRAKEYLEEFQLITQQLRELQILQDNLYEYDQYMLAESIRNFIESEYEAPDCESTFSAFLSKADAGPLDYEAAFVRLRYGETLYCRSTEQGLKIARDALSRIKKIKGEQDKFYLWAKMDIAFLNFVLTGETSSILKIHETHQQLRREFYNDYRKRSVAVASCYFMSGELELGAQFLFDEYMQPRELRPRQKSFYYETLALYELLRGQTREALNALNQASTLLRHIPSYVSILEHNQSVIENTGFDRKKIKFRHDNQLMDPLWYYLDPRCIW